MLIQSVRACSLISITGITEFTLQCISERYRNYIDVSWCHFVTCPFCSLWPISNLVVQFSQEHVKHLPKIIRCPFGNFAVNTHLQDWKPCLLICFIFPCILAIVTRDAVSLSCRSVCFFFYHRRLSKSHWFLQLLLIKYLPITLP